MNNKQVERFDRYNAEVLAIDNQHNFLDTRAILPRSYHSVLDLIPQELSKQKIKKPLVLDLSMGNGQTSDYLEGKGLTVVRTDISSASLKINRGLRVRGCADELPFKNESYDAVHFKDALVHIEDKEKLLDEIYRVLKPSGLLLVSTAEHFYGPSFVYIKTKKNGEMVKKERLFYNLSDYCRIVGNMEKSKDIVSIHPPYFVTKKANLSKNLRETNFRIIDYFTWTRKSGEPDWYVIPKPRIVYLAEKRQ